MDAPSIGSEVAGGRYRVEAILGQGHHSVVLRVGHQRLGTVHALKILTVTSPGVGARLGEAGATVQHPGLVRTTDVLEVDGQPALLMELVEGTNLEAWLGQRQAVDLARALHLFRAIAEALAAAHGAGVVHGDLTPRSVLVPSAPGGPPARVVDLGLAVALQDPGGPRSRTHSGMPMGSPAYQAPEQIRDARDLDARADVFALGCLLFELVGGGRAFPGGFGDVVEAITAGRHAPIDPSVPAGIAELITACLQVDRAARPPDARDVLARLDAVAAPTPASPPTTDSPPAVEGPAVEGPAVEGPAESDPAPAPAPQTSPAPANRRVDPRIWASLALGLVAAISVAGLGVAGIAGLGVVGLGMWSAADEPPPPTLTDGPCPGVRGEVVGYVWAGRRFTTPTGNVWLVDTDRNVRADHPREENGWAADALVVCVLAKGLRMRVEADPIAVPGAVWVPVVAGAVEGGSR